MPTPKHYIFPGSQIWTYPRLRPNMTNDRESPGVQLYCLGAIVMLEPLIYWKAAPRDSLPTHVLVNI